MRHEHTFHRRPDGGIDGGIARLWDACDGPAPRLRQDGGHRLWETTSLLAALVVMLGLFFVVISAKPALSQAVELVKVDVQSVGKGYRASSLIGATVTNDKNERIGKLDDIIIGKDNVMYAVLQVGGFLGLGSRLVAVPFNSVKIDDNGKKVELPGATKEELQKLAEFKYLG